MSSPKPTTIFIKTPGSKAKGTKSPKTENQRMPETPSRSERPTWSPKSLPTTPSRTESSSHARSASDSSSGLRSILKNREAEMNPSMFSPDAGRENTHGKAIIDALWQEKKKSEEKAPAKGMRSPPRRKSKSSGEGEK
ncbi:uncharacterized protein CLAFUR5_14655 [Fulvia fulva]|uniref:Uncharacterized protein n=1 Tax=Passalora fulva TaxID=5499 RepID=A0A9Q8UWV6_PASFU|nr:uncharacterized protein CLAFUR5_14655 [Fulvia fulva]KAK4608899.1 hypothetical protein CLAFUR0_14866 [Fulvia fulva]UJO25421.1 hypothetical protein CLAFUR5_14655 [Fulvia fulva]